MNHSALTYKIGCIFESSNQSFFTSFIANKNSALDVVENRFTELKSDKIKLDSPYMKEAGEVISKYDIKVELKIISLEKNIQSIYDYIKKNNEIKSKKLYLIVSLSILEDILVNGAESIFALNVFGVQWREEDLGYLTDDIFEPLLSNYEEEDIEAVTIDIVNSHIGLIEIINSQLGRGILISWCNRFPDKLLYDNNLTFIELEKTIQLADIATIDIKLYELAE